VLQAGVSLFKNIPVAGAAISATDLLNNIIKEFDFRYLIFFVISCILSYK
jgi:hypothetical protein